MKIGNSAEKLAAPPVAAERTGAAEAGRAKAGGGAQGASPSSATGKAPEASAQVELSGTASKLLKGVSDEGSFDAAKVSRISEAITQGKFTVNAEAIADKLIANAQELVSRMSPTH